MTPITPAASAAALAQTLRRRGHGAFTGTVSDAPAISGVDDTAGSGSAMPSAARITSGVNGGSRKRTPVASKIAFAMAAVPGTDDDSPAPSGGSPGRGIIITSTTGTSRKLRIG